MRKLLLVLTTILFAGHLLAQQPAVSVYSGTADPANCKSPGRNIFLRNDTGTLKVCNAGVWIALNGGVTSAANGGTGQSTYTKGDLLAAPGGATLNKLAVGADGSVLTADTASTNGVKWAAAAGGGITNAAGANVIPKSDGTNLVASGFTDNGTTISTPEKIATAATTGLVGIGMAPNAMLDITAPAGVISIQAVGTQGAPSSTSTPVAQAVVNVTGTLGVDQSTTIANRNGGTGQPVNLTTGGGGAHPGAASGTSRGGNGGAWNRVTGPGGAATAVTGTVKGGAAGAINDITGVGGASATSNGGAGGAYNATLGDGGVTTAAAPSGKGGSYNFAAGNGGANSNAAGTAGPGGDITFTAGTAGTPSGGAAAGVAGAIRLAGELLTDDQSRVAADIPSANTTFINMTGISRSVLAAGNYVGELIVKCNNSTAAEGIKFDFNGGTATMTAFWAAGNQLIGGTNVLGSGISTSLAGVLNFSTITGETVIVIKVSFVVNAAGTVIPRFAENSTAIGTATVELGSFMTLNKSS